MPTFASKCLPLELLYEIVPFIPAENAVPNALSSCSLLHNLLLPRVVKWKEKEMDEKLLKMELLKMEEKLSKKLDQVKEELENKLDEKLFQVIEELEEKLSKKLDQVKEELEDKFDHFRLEFNQKFDDLEARVGALERGTATNTNQGQISQTNQEKVDAIFKKYGLTRGKSRSPQASTSTFHTSENTGGLENDGNRGGEREKEQTKGSNDGDLPPTIVPLRLSLQGKPPLVPKRSSSTVLQSVERLRSIESTESTITIAWKNFRIPDVEIECYEVQYMNVHGLLSTKKSQRHAFLPKKSYTVVVKNLKPATTYALTVLALNKHGNTVDCLTMPPVATKPRFT